MPNTPDMLAPISVTISAAAARRLRETAAQLQTTPDLYVMALLETRSLGLTAMPEPRQPVEELTLQLPSRLLSERGSGRAGGYDSRSIAWAIEEAPDLTSSSGADWKLALRLLVDLARRQIEAMALGLPPSGRPTPLVPASPER
jgi:hypothetical protein